MPLRDDSRREMAKRARGDRSRRNNDKELGLLRRAAAGHVVRERRDPRGTSHDSSQ